MISAWFPLLRFGSLCLTSVVGLSVAMGPSPAHSETCSLPSLHAGEAFPVELVEADWACRLQPIISNYTTANKLGPLRTPLSESVYLHLLDHPPMTVSLTIVSALRPINRSRGVPCVIGAMMARELRGPSNSSIRTARAGSITWKDRTTADFFRISPERPWCCSG